MNSFSVSKKGVSKYCDIWPQIIKKHCPSDNFPVEYLTVRRQLIESESHYKLWKYLLTYKSNRIICVSSWLFSSFFHVLTPLFSPVRCPLGGLLDERDMNPLYCLRLYFAQSIKIVYLNRNIPIIQNIKEINIKEL